MFMTTSVPLRRVPCNGQTNNKKVYDILWQQMVGSCWWNSACLCVLWSYNKQWSNGIIIYHIYLLYKLPHGTPTWDNFRGAETRNNMNPVVLRCFEGLAASDTLWPTSCWRLLSLGDVSIPVHQTKATLLLGDLLPGRSLSALKMLKVPSPASCDKFKTGRCTAICDSCSSEKRIGWNWKIRRKVFRLERFLCVWYSTSIIYCSKNLLVRKYLWRKLVPFRQWVPVFQELTRSH